MAGIAIADLKRIKSAHQGIVALRAGPLPEGEPAVGTASQIHVLVCSGTGCMAGGSQDIREALEREIQKHNLSDRVKVFRSGCQGFCAAGPLAIVKPENIFYTHLNLQDIPPLVEEHFINRRPYEKLLYKPEKNLPALHHLNDIPFFSRQVLISFKNRGMIDPESIDDYIGTGGYEGLLKALFDMTPDKIIEEVTHAGLRGRGGAGYPTGFKWMHTRKARGPVKYMLCNADEGDPGAFMDRSLLESDPHAVIEGMIIAARAIDSTQGYIYVRAEYPLAIERLKIAISQARAYGLLGHNILGSDFSFELDLYYGAGAFVCGEATALMRSIEGKRGMPRPKPPHTADTGLWERPTVLNNVETFSNVPQIIVRGSAWYSSIGTKTSKGTKLFALTGAVRNIGLVEVPMGTTLREIICDIGGGIKGGKRFKAVQLGGPSGGCLPEELLDTPVDYEAIAKTGAIMGSGGMVVMDEASCMVDIAKYFLDFTVRESCGKCTVCRIGTSVMLDMLQAITQGNGKPGDIELLESLSRDISSASLCGLGQSAPNPVLTTIRYFRAEYEEHIFNKRCSAGVCKALIEYFITEKCTGCTACAKVCPVHCITGERKKRHEIGRDLCVKCGACRNTCRFDAIDVRQINAGREAL